MSKLEANQQTIGKIFLDEKRKGYLIPDYQRPYAWGIDECRALWDDLISFTYPNGNPNDFNEDSQYFLGPIVTFENSNGEFEVIDGQQRLTTLVLMFRAFLSYTEKIKDPNIESLNNNLRRIIWLTDNREAIMYDKPRVKSLVATDDDVSEYLKILEIGSVDGKINNYTRNFKFFHEKINEILRDYPSTFIDLPWRLIDNCIILQIRAESQDMALKIFSTLNNRGKPLADADIFKAQLYKYYSDLGKKKEFMESWKFLEEKCNDIFNSASDSPLDEIFTKYMYYERSLKGNKSSTTESLRKFYEYNNYEILKNSETLNNLIKLTKFWTDIYNQDPNRFSEDVLKRLFVLEMAPNSMWTYILSVYFMTNVDSDGNLNETDLLPFLDKIIGFIWTFAFTNPGINALRTPIYAEMVNIVKGIPVTFKDTLFEEDKVRNIFDLYAFTNQRPITRSMLAWWAFQDKEQKVLSNDTKFDIEHIYAKKRYEFEKSFKDEKNLEKLGNKILLEKRINIRAADYRFEDKKKYYSGYGKKEASEVAELNQICKNSNFEEEDIEKRNQQIIDGFIEYLRNNNLIKTN